MAKNVKPIEQYMALALQPVMRGAHKRADIMVNIDHIAELSRSAVWLSAIDLPVRLIAIPEGALQGFTDEIFDWDHEHYVETMAIDVPGEETKALGELARELNTFLVAQAKVRHPEFESAFSIAPSLLIRAARLFTSTTNFRSLPASIPRCRTMSGTSGPSCTAPAWMPFTRLSTPRSAGSGASSAWRGATPKPPAAWP